jgi:predicted negative regulator of RcsB-dependent stress response
MIDPRYSEDEQAERLKEWWKKNGTSIVFGVVIGVGAIVGVNYWRDYTRTQSETASALYSRLVAGDAANSGDLSSELMQDYSSTPYAGLAALFSAKAKYEAGEAEEAAGFLRWALENSSQAGIQHPARLRLARVLLEQGETDQAAKLGEIEDYGGFASEYLELQGDVAMARGDAAAARSAYEEALRELIPGSPYGDLLAMKIDSAAGALEK